MRYLALATDYDGTIAAEGKVLSSTVAALERYRESGRHLLLVTGRELPELKRVFSRLDLFDRVVAENGALLYRPASGEEQSLAEAPPQAFTDCLTRHNVPFSVGRGIVATSEPYQQTVLECIRDLGLELNVIFNKGAVMVLPSGVNKATGLHCALVELGFSEHNVVAVGDGENDHALLAASEFSVAVANAVPMLKERADLVTREPRGAGVEQLITEILEDDLVRYDDRVNRRKILLGHTIEADHEEKPVCISPYRGSLLFAGPSGSGKSTAASGLIERTSELGYQFCLIDPEGDYANYPGALIFGTPNDAPEISEIVKALNSPTQNIVVNLLGIPLTDRPLFFASLLPELLKLRSATARPHWIIVDEAHHLLPDNWTPAPANIPQSLSGLILITVHPDWVAESVLQQVDLIVAVGKEAQETLNGFAHAIGETAPEVSSGELQPGTAAVWFRRASKEALIVKTEQAKFERRRHTRKYAEGDLGSDRSFYFRGPQAKLNLRAQNLNTFVQLADGIDDETWLHHLRLNEYSTWMRKYIKDESLANEVADVEHALNHDPQKSRELVKAAIEKRYMAA